TRSAPCRGSRAAAGQRGAGGRAAGGFRQIGTASADAGGAIAMSFRRFCLAAAASGLVVAALHGRVMAFPVEGDQTALPVNTELNEDALMRPREVFRSEFTGRKSYLVNLGNLAFSSPSILGGVARQANMSCGTCHVNGAGNAKFFMPKMSTRPGNFDTTG